MSGSSEDDKGQLHQGPDYSAPYPVSRLSPAMELVDLAAEIAKADDMLSVRTNAKLRVIADQVKALQQEARRIMEEAQRDTDLNHARCGFKKIPGRIYHLYRTPQGLSFSMLSPQDYGGKPPHAYVGAYRLENDFSWTEIKEDEAGADQSS